MASSSVEIVSDSTQQSEIAVTEPANNTDTVTIDDVFAASSHGYIGKLRKFVEEDGASLSLPDKNGHYALQWAALNRFPQIVHYIVEHGGDVNAADNSQQTALHWAAMGGSTCVANLLLQNGARLEAADVNGYRAVHIAAQRGQTSFLYHIVTKHNAHFDALDNDGRSPLYWAAYKGYFDTARLLHSSQQRQDKEGNTPTNLSSYKFHKEFALLLFNAGQAQGKHLNNASSSSSSRKPPQKGENWPMIIAMQGDAYTGKSYLADKLAFRLKCPLLCLDDFLDAGESMNIKKDALISLAISQITQIVKTQISSGFSVIIDSPLSSLSHLHQFVALISTENRYQTRLLIMECKPKNKYAFQLIFEEHGSTTYSGRWHKPAPVWPLPEILRDYTDADIPPMVSKLIVDTTEYYSPCKMFNAMFDLTSCGSGHIAQYSPCWSFIHPDKKEQFICPTCTPTKFTTTGKADYLHRLTLHPGIHHSNKLCDLCDEQVSGSCYTCSDCPLTLHKSCAELDQKRFEPESFPIFMSIEPHLSYFFPVERPCIECRGAEKVFSRECEACLFVSHLKSRLVPTVVQHKAHEHFCTILISSDGEGLVYEYMCMACRKNGTYVAYHLSAHVMYHPKCLLLPPSVNHTHDGHKHDLEMVFSRVEEMEDYQCLCCLGKMDPKAWYYYCAECDVQMHLECAFKDFSTGEQLC